MESCRVDTSQYKNGDEITVFVRDEHTEKVRMVGRDTCPAEHPIWEIVSGPRTGKRISCSDVIYM